MKNENKFSDADNCDFKLIGKLLKTRWRNS